MDHSKIPVILPCCCFTFLRKRYLPARVRDLVPLWGLPPFTAHLPSAAPLPLSTPGGPPCFSPLSCHCPLPPYSSVSCLHKTSRRSSHLLRSLLILEILGLRSVEISFTKISPDTILIKLKGLFPDFRVLALTAAFQQADKTFFLFLF